MERILLENPCEIERILQTQQQETIMTCSSEIINLQLQENPKIQNVGNGLKF